MSNDRLADRLRAGVECAPWVIDAVRELEAELCRLSAVEAEKQAQRHFDRSRCPDLDACETAMGCLGGCTT